MQIEVAGGFAGPPTMGHGGYVAGLFATRTKGPVQVTLKRPTPLDAPLELDTVDEEAQLLVLRSGDDVIAESQPAALDIDVPRPPTLADARAAEAGSPSHFDGRGVHPTCFGCGLRRPDGSGLRIAAGPIDVDGVKQVAGGWIPGAEYAGPDGTVDPQWVLAALDCPGAFAFIVNGTRAGLLGRIVFEQYGDVRAGDEHIVSGWEIGQDGRKLLAGTALFTAGGELLAAAKATWFQMQPR
jgi:hypothetical protein